VVMGVKDKGDPLMGGTGTGGKGEGGTGGVRGVRD
jgi:hypothetical protein